MLYEELKVIEDRTEEEDYPPSEVDVYDDSSSEEEDEDEDEEQEPSTGQGGDVGTVMPYTGGECRLLVKIEPTPVAYFLHLVDDTFLASICENTNRQATRVTSPAEEEDVFDTLHLDELKVFLGIVLHACHGAADVEVLFERNSVFEPRFHRLFVKSMTQDRFLSILRHLHFSPQPDELTTLAALGNVVEHFNTKMENTYRPGRDLCIYNSVVIWRGGILCRERVARYFDGKHGMAVDALTEPTSTASGRGLTLRLRASPQALELETAGSALGALVVDGLMQGLLDRGHALYLDPFYCSTTMARRLRARGTSCTGLMVGARRARCERGVVVGPWSSGGTRFSYVTTESVSSTTAAGGSRRRPPGAVAAYLRAAQGDRRAEELRLTPGGELRLRWPKQVFLLALHTLARNACTLYRRYSGDTMTFRLFITKVSIALLPLDMDDLSDDDDDPHGGDAHSSRHL